MRRKSKILVLLAVVMLASLALTAKFSTAAIAVNTSGAAPAVGVDQNGNRYAFWENANQGLETAMFSASSGTWSTPSAVTVNGNGMGPLGSEPTVAVNYQTGDQYVFWKGTGSDPQLWEAYHNANGWHGPNQVKDSAGDGMGPLGSRPSAVMNNNTGREYIYWQSTTGTLEYTIWSGQSFQQPSQLKDLNGNNMGILGSEPSAGLASGTTDDYTFVVWESAGSSDQLYFTIVGSGTADISATEAIHADSSGGTSGLGPLGSQPAVGVAPVGTSNCLRGTTAVWMSTDGNLEYSSFMNGSLWTTEQQLEVGPLGSAPSITCGTALDVYWKGTNGHLWLEYHNSNGWHGPDDQGFGLN